MDGPGTRALRRGRWSAKEHIYLVTTVTAHRRKLFRDVARGRCVVRAMRALAHREEALTLTYVVMPDHIHWLVQLQALSLSQAVARMKGRAAFELRKRAVRGAVWQPGYHDRALRRDEDLASVARYVVANPLRAGLVKRVGDYPLWDAVWLSLL